MITLGKRPAYVIPIEIELDEKYPTDWGTQSNGE